MVYYNPYSRIFYAIKRALKTFFYTLFSKSILIFIIILLLGLLFITNKAEASTINEVEPQFTDGRYHTFYMSDFVYNEKTDTYDCEFYTYLGSLDSTQGTDYFWSAKIPIPSTIYNQDRWVLHLVSNGATCFPEIVVIDGQSSLYIGRRSSSYDTLRVVKSLTGSAIGLKRYQYLNWEGTFNLTKEYTSNDYYVQRRYWQPNGILYCKNCRVQFYDYTVTPHNYVDYTSMTIRPNIDLQNLGVSASDSSLFILDLGYFHDLSVVNGDDNLTNVLQNINVTIKDLSTDNTFSKDLKLTKVIQEDEDGNYYIDFDVWDVSTQLGTGNYLISIEPILKSTLHNGTYFTTNWLDYDTIINYTKYYTFSANNGYITNLTNSNSDGTPITPPDEPEEPEEDINNTVNDINNFLQDGEYNQNTITDNMPNNEEFQDITESGFNNIFTTLRNVFTSTDYRDVEFVVPFSNEQKIIIPSNLTERIVPASIVSLIQMVYWYFIARYIVKDIANYIEKSKSGDIFNSTDTNIKTDML